MFSPNPRSVCVGLVNSGYQDEAKGSDKGHKERKMKL